MSEIDKLINQAFPDELRDVEPIDVDEDAILSMTLESLGLKPLLKPELPELPARRRRRAGEREQEPEFVEVPVVVRRRWMDWAGWAIAACLVLAFAVNWGPWLIDNLGFGLRPRSSGDMPVSESSEVYEMDSGSGASVYIASVSYGNEEMTLNLTLTPVMEPENLDLDEFTFEMTGDTGKALTRKSRRNEGNRVTLEYDLDGSRHLILTVRKSQVLRDGNGSEVGFAYKDVDKMELNLNNGRAESLLKNGRFEFDIYGTVAEPEPPEPED